MSKIKLYLLKSHKKILYEVIHIDESIHDKGFKNDENQLLIVSKNSWSSSDTLPTGVRSTNFKCVYANGLYLNLNLNSLYKVQMIHFKTDNERDLWYDRILNSLKNVEWVYEY